ncbi:hypothetical protein Patl1_06875 [Pistacia atlantica]|uniref:Uncharacterized protein n=1 Tax=Pistacia atlantica TaxID=434234 RepID=A0ACC1AKU9_9ROSI|nr:hypothetical protein Patl1_06875 [Pistacia atlantica]
MCCCVSAVLQFWRSRSSSLVGFVSAVLKVFSTILERSGSSSLVGFVSSDRSEVVKNVSLMRTV